MPSGGVFSVIYMLLALLQYYKHTAPPVLLERKCVGFLGRRWSLQFFIELVLALR